MRLKALAICTLLTLPFVTYLWLLAPAEQNTQTAALSPEKASPSSPQPSTKPRQQEQTTVSVSTLCVSPDFSIHGFNPAKRGTLNRTVGLYAARYNTHQDAEAILNLLSRETGIEKERLKFESKALTQAPEPQPYSHLSQDTRHAYANELEQGHFDTVQAMLAQHPGLIYLTHSQNLSFEQAYTLLQQYANGDPQVLAGFQYPAEQMAQLIDLFPQLTTSWNMGTAKWNLNTVATMSGNAELMNFWVEKAVPFIDVNGQNLYDFIITSSPYRNDFKKMESVFTTLSKNGYYPSPDSRQLFEQRNPGYIGLINVMLDTSQYPQITTPESLDKGSVIQDAASMLALTKKWKHFVLKRDPDCEAAFAPHRAHLTDAELQQHLAQLNHEGKTPLEITQYLASASPLYVELYRLWQRDSASSVNKKTRIQLKQMARQKQWSEMLTLAAEDPETTALVENYFVYFKAPNSALNKLLAHGQSITSDAFINAVKISNVPFIEFYQTHNQPLDVLDKFNRNALYYAAINGNARLYSALRAAGLSHYEDIYGLNPSDAALLGFDPNPQITQLTHTDFSETSHPLFASLRTQAQ